MVLFELFLLILRLILQLMWSVLELVRPFDEILGHLFEQKSSKLNSTGELRICVQRMNGRRGFAAFHGPEVFDFFILF